MAPHPRKIGIKNEKFSAKIVPSSSSGRKTAPRRSTSFYVLCFLLVVLVLSGVFEMIVHIKRGRVIHRRAALYRGGRAFSSERARLSERLWDTLVPERNWTPFTPQFWVLLVATVSLYSYNRRRSSEQEDVIALEDKKRAEALSRLGARTDA